MDKRLREADRALLEFLHKHPEGVTMEQILDDLRDKVGEQELRAAVWKLLGDDLAEFHHEKLRELAVA